MVQTATKKPITIQFVRYTNLNREEVEQFVGSKLKMELESETAYLAGVAPPCFSITIPTLEGDMKAMPGDAIIRGVNNEFYPCKWDILEKSYDIHPIHSYAHE